ncbi:MAG: hypothetical protein ACHQ50_10230 [Fimbriimonadales bacterium]
MSVLAAFALFYLGQSYAADSRLDKIIDVRIEAKPAPETCSTLSKLTGVDIRCNPYLNSDLVVLLAKSLPAREVMAKVAGHFGWQWRTLRSGGYELEPSAQFRRLAADAGASEWLARSRGLRIAATKRLQYLGGIDPAAKQREKRQVAEKISEIYRLSDEKRGTKEKEAEELGHRESILWEQTDPLQVLLLTVAASLTDQQLLELRHQAIRFSTVAKPWAYGFGSTAKAVIRQALDNYDRMQEEARAFAQYTSTHPRDGEKKLDDYLPRTCQRWFRSGDVRSVSVTLGSPEQGSVSLFDANGTVLAESLLDGLNASTGESIDRIHDEDIQFLPSRAFTDAERQDIEKVGSYRDLAAEASRGETWLAEGRALCDCADAAGVNLISDLYDDLKTGSWAFPKSAPGQCLYHFGWECERSTFNDGWVRLRCQDWPEHRAAQLDRPTLTNVGRKIAKQGGLSLDQQADLALRLLDEQAGCLLLQNMAPDWSGSTDFLRFWARTPGSVKQRLIDGAVVKASDCGTQAIPHLYAWLRRSGIRPVYFLPCGTGSASIWEEPEFSESKPTLTATLGVADVLPMTGPDDITIRLKRAKIPSMTATLKASGWVGDQAPPMIAAYLEHLPELLRDGYTPLQFVEHDCYQFDLTVAGSYSDSIRLEGRRSLGPASLDLGAFPPDLSRRVKEHMSPPKTPPPAR